MAVDAGGELTALPAATTPRLPPVGADEYDSFEVRLANRRAAADRLARTRGQWWFPLFVALIVVSGFWVVLKSDQWIADELVWPTSGAQFVEVGPLPADPTATGDRVIIVVAGLNRKSGTGVAASLMPSLAVDGTRVFSLVYGSGINDRDILEKFDTLLAQYRPREVSFFGSSMGGDVVLGLAAHTQDLRADYRRTLITASGAAAVDSPALGSPALDSPASDSSALDSSALGTAGQSGVGGRAASGEQPGARGHTAPAPAPRDNRVGGGAATAGQLLLTPDQATGSTGTAGTAVELPGPLNPAMITAAAGDAYAPPPPRLGTIYLDCSPLGVDDVRDSSRTSADALTALIEALDSEGGVAVRMTAELLGQQQQWSSGRFPFVQVRGDDFRFKFDQVWREKIGAPGISTQLIKDQYGVIRRTDINAIVDSLGPGVRIVYFLPEQRHDDRTVRVERVERRLVELAAEKNLDVQIVPVPGGHHASAESDPEVYRKAIDEVSVGGN